MRNASSTDLDTRQATPEPPGTAAAAETPLPPPATSSSTSSSSAATPTPTPTPTAAISRHGPLSSPAASALLLKKFALLQHHIKQESHLNLRPDSQDSVNTTASTSPDCSPSLSTSTTATSSTVVSPLHSPHIPSSFKSQDTYFDRSGISSSSSVVSSIAKDGYLGDSHRGSGIGVGLGRGAYDSPVDTCANCSFSLPQDLSQQLPDGAPGSPSKAVRGKNGSAMLRTKETYVAGDLPLEDKQLSRSSGASSASSSSSSSSSATSRASRRRCPSFSEEDHGSSPDSAKSYLDGSRHKHQPDRQYSSSLGSTPSMLPYLAHANDKAAATSDSSSGTSPPSSSSSYRSSSESYHSSHSNSTAATLPSPPPPHPHTLSYLTARHPPTNKAFSLLRRSCIRTLSCEQIPTPSGPIFYGDRTTGYTSAFVFRLPDPRARGRRRSYALIAVYGGGGNTGGGMSMSMGKGKGMGVGDGYPIEFKDFIRQDGGYYNPRELFSGAPQRPENMAILWNEWIRKAFESVASWIMGLAAATAAANSDFISPIHSASSSYQPDSQIGSMTIGSPVSPIKTSAPFGGIASSSITSSSNATSSAIAISGARARERPKQPTPTSSFLSLRNVDPDGYPRRRGEMRATGLPELVGKEDIFVDIHAVFAQLLSGLAKSGLGLGPEGSGGELEGRDFEMTVRMDATDFGIDEMTTAEDLWDKDAHREEPRVRGEHETAAEVCRDLESGLKGMGVGGYSGTVSVSV
ncbi:MAG: hypothetical protein M1829_002522 [Trizodia sp. TS-e1964]|nr:MAG: hypothetical protein M1829_002522 [Trizodia sp. TS-e1964]